jgi:hypothetical protein
MSKPNRGFILYIQLLSLDVELDPLSSLNDPVPLDLVLSGSGEEVPLLYRFAPLLDQRQIRVTVPVTNSFVNAVRLALALSFAVKLEVGQPDRKQVEELRTVLDLYLHRSTVVQPVEYFHSTFLSYFNNQPANLWSILEEDPEEIRFVSEEGQESVSSRLKDSRLTFESGRVTLESGLVTRKSECDDCEFFDRCGGYFKWPNANFSCEGVKTLFATIRSAAAQLHEDVKQVPATQRG